MGRIALVSGSCAVLLMAGCQTNRVLTPDDIAPSAGMPVQASLQVQPPATRLLAAPQPEPAYLSPTPEVQNPVAAYQEPFAWSEPEYAPAAPEPEAVTLYDPVPISDESALGSPLAFDPSYDPVVADDQPIYQALGETTLSEPAAYEQSDALTILPNDSLSPSVYAPAPVAAESVPDFTPIPQPGLTNYGSAF